MAQAATCPHCSRPLAGTLIKATVTLAGTDLIIWSCGSCGWVIHTASALPAA